MGAFLKVLIFLKISGLCQKHALSRNLLEKLGKVFKNNFLTAMYDLKRRIKSGTAKNRCHTISEQGLEWSQHFSHYKSMGIFPDTQGQLTHKSLVGSCRNLNPFMIL